MRILLGGKGQPEKAPECVIPTIQRSGKGRAMEAIKEVTARVERKGKTDQGPRRILGQCSSSVWCGNSGPVILHCSKPTTPSEP